MQTPKEKKEHFLIVKQSIVSIFDKNELSETDFNNRFMLLNSKHSKMTLKLVFQDLKDKNIIEFYYPNESFEGVYKLNLN